MIEGIPFSEPSEKWMLSALMKDSALLAAHPLNPDAFHLPTHRTIYRRMLATGETDVVILADTMNVNGEADFIPALADLLNYAVGPHFNHHLTVVRECFHRRKAVELAREIMVAANDRSDPDRCLAALAKAGDVMKLAAAPDSTDSMVRGFSAFPTDPLPENILAGDAWLRVGDVHFFNSSAGAGKSVALIQASMAWALGLPFLGIKPSRPLRILHFIGEDDESTLGQCREGFLENAVATFGRKITAAEIASLDDMVRTDFSRQYTGNGFVARLERILADEHADLVLINPLLSFIGGDIVKEASEFLRGGIMPIMQRHRAACLIAHHTCKLTKTSWAEMDFTYSGIGGGEVANVPRSILTLTPTKAKGLHALYISKRTTTGWKDDQDKFTDHIYIKRTDNPSRPAWLPVSHEDAAAMIGDNAPSGFAEGRTKKATVGHIVEAVRTAAMARPALLAQIQRENHCTETPAKNALREARERGLVGTFEQPTPGGGKKTIWVCLPEHLTQWVK
jgi:hypothetical protein